ncbi:Fc.00g007170.m01.CDS01 [Cosmosporella sp. VM-42]
MDVGSAAAVADLVSSALAWEVYQLGWDGDNKETASYDELRKPIQTLAEDLDALSLSLFPISNPLSSGQTTLNLPLRRDPVSLLEIIGDHQQTLEECRDLVLQGRYLRSRVLKLQVQLKPEHLRERILLHSIKVKFVTKAFKTDLLRRMKLDASRMHQDLAHRLSSVDNDIYRLDGYPKFDYDEALLDSDNIEEHMLEIPSFIARRFRNTAVINERSNFADTVLNLQKLAEDFLLHYQRSTINLSSHSISEEVPFERDGPEEIIAPLDQYISLLKCNLTGRHIFASYKSQALSVQCERFGRKRELVAPEVSGVAENMFDFRPDTSEARAHGTNFMPEDESMREILEAPLESGTANVQRSIRLFRHKGMDGEQFYINIYDVEQISFRKGRVEAERIKFDLASVSLNPMYVIPGSQSGEFDMVLRADESIAMLKFQRERDLLKFQQALTGFKPWASYTESNAMVSFVTSDGKDSLVESACVQLWIPKQLEGKLHQNLEDAPGKASQSSAQDRPPTMNQSKIRGGVEVPQARPESLFQRIDRTLARQGHPGTQSPKPGVPSLDMPRQPKVWTPKKFFDQMAARRRLPLLMQDGLHSSFSTPKSHRLSNSGNTSTNSRIASLLSRSVTTQATRGSSVGGVRRESTPITTKPILVLFTQRSMVTIPLDDNTNFNPNRCNCRQSGSQGAACPIASLECREGRLHLEARRFESPSEELDIVKLAQGLREGNGNASSMAWKALKRVTIMFRDRHARSKLAGTPSECQCKAKTERELANCLKQGHRGYFGEVQEWYRRASSNETSTYPSATRRYSDVTQSSADEDDGHDTDWIIIRSGEEANMARQDMKNQSPLQLEAGTKLTFQVALAESRVSDLESLLHDSFDAIAQDEFKWLSDLKDVGMGSKDIVKILLQAYDGSPWVPTPDWVGDILFGSEQSSAQKVPVNFHQASCAHRLGAPQLEKHLSFSSLAFSDKNETTIEKVAWLCGLAGVLPPEHAYYTVAKATFSGSTAEISYHDSSPLISTPGGVLDPEHVQPFAWCLRTIRQIQACAIELQNNGLCCDRYTVLTLPLPSQLEGLEPSIHLKTITFECINGLEEALMQLLETEANPDFKRLRADCNNLLSGLLGYETNEKSPVLPELHLLSLVVQFLGLSLVSYCRSHIGEFQPPFLKEPLSMVKLRGCTVNNPLLVTARPYRLACMAPMLQDDVFAFSVQFEGGAAEHPLTSGLYVSGNCESIVDTWGPASVMMEAGSPPGEKLHGLCIGGGVIAPSKDGLFHWTSDIGLSSDPRSFTYWELITVGAPSVNKACLRNEEKSYRISELCLTTCGTESTQWIADERQILLQSGQYLQMSVGNVYHKVPKKTLKAFLLDTWATLRDVRIFNYFFGVQVSLCTGVARRVPLRALIEDPLLHFVDTLRIEGWTALKPSARKAFAGEVDYDDWIGSLDDKQHKCIREVCGKLLELLKNTGFDRNGTMRVLWPSKTNPYLCAKAIPEKAQVWCRMLRDSEWCATFVVATRQCLETDNQRCQKKQVVPWHGGGTVFTTAVFPNFTIAPTSPIPQLMPLGNWGLEDGGSYWIGQPGADTWVSVRKTTAGSAELFVRQNLFPRSVARWMWQDRVLRERSDSSFAAEEVVVLYIPRMQR